MALETERELTLGQMDEWKVVYGKIMNLLAESETSPASSVDR